ncbi:chaperone protein DnaJ-like [Eriocheir sinensis]|uniref:chaperone protein DnaJ-like n=1 Tax=Eriocheir sinensis TaxID=95602 RepID=UPI0021C7445D|nr:chaperone protein DnaJ-like [Eriocheir sinensis]
MSTPGYLNPPMPNRGDVLNRRPYDSTRAPMACPQRSIYRFLGVAEDAPFAEVKKAYHKAALRLHPDKNPDNIKAATKQFQALQSAFRVLKEREGPAAEEGGLREAWVHQVLQEESSAGRGRAGGPSEREEVVEERGLREARMHQVFRKGRGSERGPAERDKEAKEGAQEAPQGERGDRI